MKEIVIKMKSAHKKFEITISDYPCSKKTIIFVQGYEQQREINGRFGRYSYRGAVRKTIKASTQEARNKILLKYLAKFGVEKL